MFFKLSLVYIVFIGLFVLALNVLPLLLANSASREVKVLGTS